MTEANFPPNPYIIGKVIDNPNRFFGRQELFQFIESNLLQGSKVILLHGQRRIGKSSILHQIPESVFKDNQENRKNFVFVVFDLENKSRSTLGEILHDLATKIVETINALELNKEDVKPPTQEVLERKVKIFHRSFLPKIDDQLDFCNLVLLLDEFDVLNTEEIDNHQNPNIREQEIEKKGGSFFRYLKYLVNHQEQLFVIPVVGRHPKEMPKLLELFDSPPNINIGLLKPDEAIQLITKPVAGVLEYSEDAIAEILDLSAGHPYFTQAICSKLYQQARTQQQRKITREDVNDDILNSAIESVESGLDWFWRGLSEPAQLFFLAVAEVHTQARNQGSEVSEEPLDRLKKIGINKPEILIKEADNLAEQGFLDNTKTKVTIKLVRRWLVENYRLWEIIKELREKDAIKFKTLYEQPEGNMSEANFTPNPYIIGSAIDDPNKFFGRQDLFQNIESNLLQGSKVILLHGQRRIGKSSVLYQIPKSVFKDYEEQRNQFSFIFFDLQNKSSQPLAKIIHDLATKISTDLRLNSTIVPTLEELENNTDIFARRFLPKVDQELGYKNLVLLLDEFDVLNEDNPNENNNTDIENKGGGFFRYLQLLVNRQQQLFIIPVVGRHLDELSKLLILFKGALNQNIGLLKPDEARQLITKPVEGVLEYGEDAIQAILALSAGHPYFTQAICSNLYQQARSNNHQRITDEDVKNIIEKAIESAEGGLDWFWNGLSMTEQVVFSAVAKAEFPEDPFAVLRKNGVIETEILFQAAEKLVEQGFVDKPKDQPDYTQSKVKVEFVRRWLLQRHSLEIEIWELEKIDEEKVKRLRDAAEIFKTQTNHQRALELYEEVLKINPNHFSTVLDLAEGYSKLENFEKALEFYTRAYQFDPLRNTKTLVRELENYGSHLFTNQDLNRAKQQYQRVLEIQPRRKQAQLRLKEIEAVQSQLTWRCEGYKDEPHSPQTINIGQNCPVCNRSRDSGEYSSNHQVAINPPKKPIISPVILAKFTNLSGMIALAVFGITLGFGIIWSINSLFTPCPAGQQKEFGLLCRTDNSKMSRGERTLFPTVINSNRDKGIEAYKKRNYADAVNLFQSAVKDAKNDPEVLIYYNNALARSKGSFITLAVVVPVDKNSTGKAQEILRGVAQAQNQFNQKNGLNGRLLEIAIANDGTQEKDTQLATAKQVAQELVKDPDILGVIGHNSSDATKAALEEYEKAKIPVISSTSTSIKLSSSFFFRTAPSDAASGKILAEYAIDSGLKKAVIFSNNNSKYSDSLREKFQSNFEKLGGEVVKGDRPIELNDNPQLDGSNAISASIFRYQTQVAVLFPDKYHITQAINIARSHSELMDRVTNPRWQRLKFLGGDTLYSEDILKQGEKAVEGLVLAVPWFRETTSAQNFASSAQQQWGAPVSWRTATSYDATQAFIKAMQTASSNLSRETVLQALRNVKLDSNETSGEVLQFQDGEPQSKPILVQVKDGKFTLVPSVANDATN